MFEKIFILISFFIVLLITNGIAFVVCYEIFGPAQIWGIIWGACNVFTVSYFKDMFTRYNDLKKECEKYKK